MMSDGENNSRENGVWSPNEILRVRDLSKEFTIHERKRHLKAFESVAFSAHGGELLALAGASGSGKSSVLKCIYRTYLSTSGRVEYRRASGEVVNLIGIDDSEVLALRRTEIRFVSQFLRVIPRRSSLQIVESALQERESQRTGVRKTAESCLEMVGLPEELWALPPNTFSGGEKQLVNLAQALAVRPRLLLLDEPTASLDPASTDRILAVISALKSPELAMIGVFHNRDIIDRLADKRIHLEGGLKNPGRNGKSR